MARRLSPFLFIFIIFTLSSIQISYEDVDRKVLLVEVNDFISTASAEHIESAIELANDQSIVAVLLTLDTFGGSVDAMFKIIDSIQASPVPVIGFVYPAGRQALSAGTYILMATDYAAMAPYTTIGSAQPISGGTPISDSKVLNAFVAKIVSLAKLHNRNVTEAERFIRNNDNLLPEEALRLGVIEAIASSPEELLSIADGSKVITLKGEKILDLQGVRIERFSPSIRTSLLKILSDPLVSSIFITIGFLALILGLASPGWGAELTGGILILLGLLGQGFNVNYIAIALLAIGSGLIIFEIYSHSLGLAAVGGIVLLGAGMALMITKPALPLLISSQYIETFIKTSAAVLSILGAFFALLIYKIVKAMKLKRRLRAVPTGEGRAVDELNEGTVGYVVVEGEYWKAKSRVHIASGERVRVVGSEGNLLIVEPVSSKKVTDPITYSF